MLKKTNKEKTVKLWAIHTMSYYTAARKNEVRPCILKWDGPQLM